MADPKDRPAHPTQPATDQPQQAPPIVIPPAPPHPEAQAPQVFTAAQYEAQLEAKAEGKSLVRAAPTNPYDLAQPQQDDIWPRPPKDLTGFLDINVPGWSMPPGLPGDYVDAGKRDQISKIPETAIPFGYAVADGSKEGFCKLATAAGDHVIGIAHRDITCPNVDCVTGNLLGYKASSWCAGVIRMGRVWAMPDAAVLRGDPVGFTATGALTKGGGTGSLASLKGAYWATAAAACEMAVVQIIIYA